MTCTSGRWWLMAMYWTNGLNCLRRARSLTAAVYSYLLNCRVAYLQTRWVHFSRPRTQASLIITNKHVLTQTSTRKYCGLIFSGSCNFTYSLPYLSHGSRSVASCRIRHRLIDWLSRVLRLRQHNIGYTADGFYRSTDPTNSVKALKEGG